MGAFVSLFYRVGSKSQQKPSAVHLDKPKPELLSIPGEIRNMIYRMALLSNGRVNISKYPLPEPALLRTCRQLRQETIAIFYLENRFSVECPDWNYWNFRGLVERLRRLKSSNDISTSRIACRPNGSLVHKPNLLEFLRATYEGLVSGLVYDNQKKVTTTAITGAFDIARTMRGQDWSTVEKVLEVYLQEVAKARVGWQWELGTSE